MVKLATPATNDDATVNQVIQNVLWAALEKIGSKEKQHDQLPQGTSHHLDLQITGEIDGQPFDQLVNSVINIGHEQTKSSSVNPQVPELIAYILSKLNRATRNRILEDIPQEFIEAGNQLPESRPVLVEEAKQMLKKLRTQKQVKARGAVRCEYTL